MWCDRTGQSGVEAWLSWARALDVGRERHCWGCGGYIGAMGNIGEDLVLLAIKRNGTIAAFERLRFALAGSELVRLVDARRIDIDHDGYIVVLDVSPTGDELADLALTSIGGAVIRLRAKEWVARQRPVLVDIYLEHLAAAGVIRSEDRKVLGLFRAQRWAVVDTARVIDAKGRLDAIVSSTGPVTREQAAFAGLVHAVGLGVWLYPRRDYLARRSRLAAIALKDETTEMVSSKPAFPGNASDASVYASDDASLQGAIWAAVRSCVDATHHAVVQHQGGHDGGSHHDGGGFHHDGGGMVGGHH